MTIMIQGKELYKLISIDSMSWLDNSEKLKLSADLIHKEFQASIDHFLNGKRDGDNEDKIQALWNSYYLFVGHAFENLIKGLSIENNRTLKSYDEIFNTLWRKYGTGHEISKIAKDNVKDLTDKEIEIFEKLETYILWAGRYPIPTTVDKFVKEGNRLVYDTNDYHRLESLFSKIKSLLIEIWEKNEYK